MIGTLDGRWRGRRGRGGRSERRRLSARFGTRANVGNHARVSRVVTGDTSVFRCPPDGDPAAALAEYVLARQNIMYCFKLYRKRRLRVQCAYS